MQITLSVPRSSKSWLYSYDERPSYFQLSCCKHQCALLASGRTDAVGPRGLIVLLHKGAGVEEEELRAAAGQRQLVRALQVPPRVRRDQRRIQLRALRQVRRSMDSC